MMQNLDMKEVATQFVLKAQRRYVHGTSIYDDFLAINNTAAFDSLDISFKQPIFNVACTWKISANSQTIDENVSHAPCFGHCFINGHPLHFALVPNESSSVPETVEYDEDDICHGCTLNSEGAEQGVNRKYSFIENLVALTKRFHNQFFPLVNNKWLFARLQVGSVPASVDVIAIKLESMIPQRLSKLQVTVNQKAIGHIYFSAGSAHD